MKISVIIPVYNVEAYIADCVRGVLMQDYEFLEVILVDDGSVDRSSEICDVYAAEDSRVKVIHKSNGGLSDARNAGVAASTGEYVLFLDGDDLWDDTHAVSILAQRIAQTNADVLNFSYVKWFEATDKKEPYFWDIPPMPLLGSISEQLDYLTDNGLYIASACNKLIRRELLIGLPFECGIYSEDIQWCAKLMLWAESMDFICENFYLYRQRSDSIRHTISDKKCADLTNSILACAKLAEEASLDRRKALLQYSAFQLGTFFMVQAQAGKMQTECISRLKTCCWLLQHHGGNRKVRILNLGCKLISFSLMCRLIRTIYHKK